MKPLIFLKKLIILFLSLFICFSCQQKSETEPLFIAISKERTAANRYGEWLNAATGRHLQIINLYPLSDDQINDTLRHCDALLLSGGADIHPAYYGKESDTLRCGAIDGRRDTLEMAAYHLAKELGMPILGICRGLQFINVAEGGSLTIDLPQDKQTGKLHRVGVEDWAYHEVHFSKDHFLTISFHDSIYTVASNHHQGIEHLAHSLQSIARSDDSLVEAIGWADETKPSFLFAVQWHPEWEYNGQPLSKQIAIAFVEAADQFRTNKRK